MATLAAIFCDATVGNDEEFAVIALGADALATLVRDGQRLALRQDQRVATKMALQVQDMPAVNRPKFLFFNCVKATTASTQARGETRTARKRRAILDAASTLFLREGYLATSMDQRPLT